ncbi:hypothetical protein QBC47DRAFT_321751 [Echria macrotheca]|uniref:Uncharacterized protein n=1 Tax=Echria macrotheca TaxID=438768 RepID=A0AAJ0BG26_9PEZI|nr:hypothetical protein QBC47DRAFT_321751 [Echria macrotheca]
MASKIALVTGANKGLGYETVKALLQSDKPYHVYLGSRSVELGQKAAQQLRTECVDLSNTVEHLQLDLTDDESISNAYNTVNAKHGRLDVLINNAGLTKDLEGLRGQVTQRESLLGSYNVNVAGTHTLTYTMMPLLLKSSDARILFVSGLGSFVDARAGKIPLPANLQPGWPKSELEFETVGYRCSKVALNMLMLDYHWKLQADGVKVWAVLPGFLATDLGDARDWAIEQGAKHPSVGGLLMRDVVEGKRDHHVGCLIDRDGLHEY